MVAINILVERRLEGEHANIMIINQQALDIITKSWASVCADLRHHMVFRLFEADIFISFLVEHCRRPITMGVIVATPLEPSSGQIKSPSAET